MNENQEKYAGHDRRLNVVDTSDVLTEDELKELKRLASASKAVRMLMVIAIGIISLIGIDRVLYLISKNH